MRENLEELRRKALEAVGNAKDAASLENIRVWLLGKKGELTSVLKQMGTLSAEERPAAGALANEVRAAIEAALEEASARINQSEMAARLDAETIDVTLPGKTFRTGRRHPMQAVLDDVVKIFLGMGFTVAEGPEVETTYYCFDALNIEPNHPARDPQDTFYFDDDTILRTQTSSVQIRIMEQRDAALNGAPGARDVGLPIRIISPGKTFRKDEIDATHSPLFHQIECLAVDKGLTMADLKGALQTMMTGLYGLDVKLRFRPHHFPYTEPSAEVDLQCFACRGEGCRMCKNEGWIEMLGSGMVHPAVLDRCNIDSSVYSGFAFGVGIERLTMMRYKINDLRLLYENDVRFLRQF
ncbi:MAG: phenylalanine--tRNA ligase subunit alpha [Oscillospiraceae bacterium]|nr:phenylalanine--tRNA ligase subunit alpha [Oscillospiraceae bacterium]